MASTTPSWTNCRASSALSHCDKERPTTSGRSQASLTTYNATAGEKTGRRPGRFLSDNPSRPCATKRRAHLRTWRSRKPTWRAVAAKVWPSASSKMACARFARPMGVFWRRSHWAKVARVWSSTSRRMADLRPCIVPSSRVWDRSYGRSVCTCPVFPPLFNGGLYLVGRDEELGLLRRRWEQAKTGEGQVILLSGEPGIGKSRLMQTLKEHASAEGATRIEFRCSPYHQNSAFYPILE